MEPNVTFVDHIEALGITEGVVRMDMAVETPGQVREDGVDPARSTVVQIVMPLSGFGRSYDLMRSLVGQLEEKGMLTRRSSTNEERLEPKEE